MSGYRDGTGLIALWSVPLLQFSERHWVRFLEERGWTCIGSAALLSGKSGGFRYRKEDPSMDGFHGDGSFNVLISDELSQHYRRRQLTMNVIEICNVENLTIAELISEMEKVT